MAAITSSPQSQNLLSNRNFIAFLHIFHSLLIPIFAQFCNKTAINCYLKRTFIVTAQNVRSKTLSYILKSFFPCPLAKCFVCLQTDKYWHFPCSNKCFAIMETFRRFTASRHPWVTPHLLFSPLNLSHHQI